MRRAVLAACLLALTVAAPSRAQDAEDLLPPPAAANAPATVARGGALDLTVRSAAPAGSVTIRVSGTPETDDYGRLHGPRGTWTEHIALPGADPTLHVWHPDRGFLARHRPGTYWWQPIITGPAAETAEDPVGAVERFTVVAPKRSEGTLTPAFGRTNHDSFYLSSAHFPAGLSAGRFRTIIKRSAARWGLTARRWTSAVAGRPDGFHVAGFGRVPKKALAMQVDFVDRAGRIRDRDLVIRPDLPWQLGPGYPAMDEYDLESVLLHELSHFAGNKRHQPRCVNSPLVEAMGAGEWWRGPQDRWSFGCESVIARAAIVHRTVRLDGPAPRRVD
jgi:hypothetical protein